jgi:copper chaperone
VTGPVAAGEGESVTSTYAVAGMTCEHCVRSVTEEVSEVPGVTAVDVDLATGRVTVTGAANDAAVRAAVAEAGYDVVDPSP